MVYFFLHITRHNVARRDSNTFGSTYIKRVGTSEDSFGTKSPLHRHIARGEHRLSWHRCGHRPRTKSRRRRWGHTHHRHSGRRWRGWHATHNGESRWRRWWGGKNASVLTRLVGRCWNSRHWNCWCHGRSNTKLTENCTRDRGWSCCQWKRVVFPCLSREKTFS